MLFVKRPDTDKIYGTNEGFCDTLMLFVSSQILIQFIEQMKILSYLNVLCFRPDTDKIYGTYESFVLP